MPADLTIVFTAPPQGDTVFAARCRNAGATPVCVNSAAEFEQYPGAGLYIDAAFAGTFYPEAVPLLFHCPARPFGFIEGAPANSARFCAWPGFWERETWELAAAPGGQGIANRLFQITGIKGLNVADIAGLVAPRILCTIINEAAFTLEAGIAGSAAIDTAMQLGTNYPFGPAGWCKSIGVSEVKQVLEAMARENEKYLPHPMLHNLVAQLL